MRESIAELIRSSNELLNQPVRTGEQIVKELKEANIKRANLAAEYNQKLADLELKRKLAAKEAKLKLEIAKKLYKKMS